uniref:Sex-determining region Y protein n=1 Tax=Macrostomum lignano TaxID=282301 RepID=A0A1I8IKX6_9PLAT
RRLGEEWRTLPDKEKQPFRDEASRLKSEHRAAHPDYKYQPKCKKRPPAHNSRATAAAKTAAITRICNN